MMGLQIVESLEGCAGDIPKEPRKHYKELQGWGWFLRTS